MTIVNGRLTRVGPGRWSKAKERALLEELALTGSVRLACRKVGLSRQAVSRRRGNDRHLDAACAAAVEIGRGKLDAWLVDAGNQTFDPDELPIADGLPKVTVAEAIQIVKLGGPRRAAAAQPEVERYDVAEVHARLLRKMELLGRHGRGEEARPGA